MIFSLTEKLFWWKLLRKRTTCNKAVSRKPGELSQIERLYHSFAAIICIKVNTIGRFGCINCEQVWVNKVSWRSSKLIKCSVSSGNTNLLLCYLCASPISSWKLLFPQLKKKKKKPKLTHSPVVQTRITIQCKVLASSTLCIRLKYIY